MLRAYAALFIGCLAATCYGQQTPGLENPWDVQTLLKKISKDNADLKSLFDLLRPQRWATEKGAPTTYILQWQSAEQQLRDIGIVSNRFAAKTDDLSLGLDNYFRLEALDMTSRNLEEGTRRYAEHSLADKINESIAKNFDDRQALRQYLKDLASSLQQNFKIADEEAQRCRGMISREPATTAKRSHK